MSRPQKCGRRPLSRLLTVHVGANQGSHLPIVLIANLIEERPCSEQLSAPVHVAFELKSMYGTNSLFDVHVHF